MALDTSKLKAILGIGILLLFSSLALRQMRETIAEFIVQTVSEQGVSGVAALLLFYSQYQTVLGAALTIFVVLVVSRKPRPK